MDMSGSDERQTPSLEQTAEKAAFLEWDLQRRSLASILALGVAGLRWLVVVDVQLLGLVLEDLHREQLQEVVQLRDQDVRRHHGGDGAEDVAKSLVTI